MRESRKAISKIVEWEKMMKEQDAINQEKKIARLKKNRDCVILSIDPIRSKSPFFIYRAVLYCPILTR